MPIKIFTTIDGPCPFGTGYAIDSHGCRKCQHFYRTGTATFFWCKHPIEQVKQRGRPKKSEPVKPVVKKKKRGQTTKKGKERPIKAIKQKIK